MFKQRIIRFILTLACLTAVTTSTGIVVDSLGYSITTSAYAGHCSGGGHC